jgi:SNF2 family DNA or RNA helicase
LLSLQALTLHGIKTLLLYGGMSPKARTEAVARLKSSGADGPRVMILSMVGLVGLNLAFANIGILPVRGIIWIHYLLLCLHVKQQF